MQVSFEGMIRKNKDTSKALVLSAHGRYYVWTAANEDIEKLRVTNNGEVPNGQLELANEHQVEIGRGILRASDVCQMARVVFHGIVSGGKNKRRILVTLPGDKLLSWYTTVINGDEALGLVTGDEVSVDGRSVSPARPDHVAAGLGLGTLERVKRVKVITKVPNGKS